MRRRALSRLLPCLLPLLPRRAGVRFRRRRAGPRVHRALRAGGLRGYCRRRDTGGALGRRVLRLRHFAHRFTGRVAGFLLRHGDLGHGVRRLGAALAHRVRVGRGGRRGLQGAAARQGRSAAPRRASQPGVLRRGRGARGSDPELGRHRRRRRPAVPGERARRSSRLWFTVGTNSSLDFNSSLRYRYVQPIGDDWRVQFSERLYFKESDGFGTITRGRSRLQHLATNRIVRWTNQVEYGEETDGVGVGHAAQLPVASQREGRLELLRRDRRGNRSRVPDPELCPRRALPAQRLPALDLLRDRAVLRVAPRVGGGVAQLGLAADAAAGVPRGTAQPPGRSPERTRRGRKPSTRLSGVKAAAGPARIARGA